MTHYNGAAAAAAALDSLGVDTIFGVPSQHNLALYDAIAHRTKIRMIGARHEAGAVHQADGYSRATGKLGVAIVSTGPGTANAVNGLYEAQFASSRVMLITTQIDRKYQGSQKGFIHDAPNQKAMLQSVSRTVHSPQFAAQIAPAILQAAQDILTGRPQPSVVEIATDVLSSAAPAPQLSSLQNLGELHCADVQPIVERLGASKRPLLWIGGGCLGPNASSAIYKLVDQFSIPVVSSPNGRGTISTDHPSYIGSTTHYPQFRELIAASDFILAIGTRFQAVATWFWSLDMHGKLAHIDIDPAVIGRNFPVEIALAADAEEALNELIQRLNPPSISADYLALARDVKARMRSDLEQRIGAFHREVCDIIDHKLPSEKIVVCDATMTGNSWGGHRLPIRDRRGFIYSTSLAIGPALPLGIGAALGSGKKTVILHGDGGVMLNLAELATAVDHNAPIILLIFNDKGYGVLRELQRLSNVPSVGVDLHTPDFAALGAAIGMASSRVRSTCEFAAAMDKAVSSDRPHLIEVDLTGVEAPKL